MRTPDIRNDAVDINKLAPSSVGTNKVVNESLIGDDVDEATLDVPLRSGGHDGFFDSTPTLLSLPGIGKFFGHCELGPEASVRFRNDSGRRLFIYSPFDTGAPGPFFGLDAGVQTTLVRGGAASGRTSQVAIGDGQNIAISAVVTVNVNPAFDCVAKVTAVG